MKKQKSTIATKNYKSEKASIARPPEQVLGGEGREGEMSEVEI